VKPVLATISVTGGRAEVAEVGGVGELVGVDHRRPADAAAVGGGHGADVSGALGV